MGIQPGQRWCMDLNKLKKRKGQSLQILMFALVIIGIGSGLLAFSNLSAAPEIVGDTMEDAPLISEAQSRTSDTTNYYVPLAAHYSVTQAIYDRGQDIVQLNSSSDIENHHGNEIDRINDLSTEYFYEYPLDLSFRRCKVDISDKKIEFGEDIAKINITQNGTTDRFVETTCRIDGSSVVASSKDDRIQKNVSNVRFHQIMTIVTETLKPIQEKAQQYEDNDNYYGTVGDSGLHCSASSTSAKNSAEASAESNARDILDAIVNDIVDQGDSNYPIDTSNNGGLFGEIVDLLTTTISYILPWDSGEFNKAHYNISDSRQVTLDSSSASRSSSCSCLSYSCCTASCYSQCCDKYEYNGQATYYYELEEITVETIIEDAKYKIPITSQWDNLNFTRRYYHDFPAGPQ